jgi:hypothetical protein
MRIDCVAALAVVSLTSASFLGMGVAHADDSSYLARLARYGFDVSTPETRDVAVKMGHSICYDLRRGVSPDEETTKLFRMTPSNATEKKVGNMVSAAQFDLCPDTL